MNTEVKNKRFFISGGNGVIGKELVNKLSSMGAIIFVGDLKPFSDDLPKNILYRQGDLNYITPEEFHSFRPDYFIHLAATFERSTETYGFWEENFRHNVRLSHYLTTIAKDSDSLKKIVFASSYLNYDPALYQFEEAQTAPVSLNENAPLYPRNLTGSAKLMHEIELRFLENFRSEQFKTVCARIFRGYGLGSRDVISRWVRSLLNNETITVFKKEGIFDYVFSKDTAEGLLRMTIDDNASGIINLGTGKARKVADVIEILKKHFPGMKTKEEESDILYEASQADITLLKKVLGWAPEYDLEKAIPEIINYEKSKLASQVKSLQLKNVLITSISKKIPLIKEVKKAALKFNPGIRVIGNDMDSECLGKYFTDEFWHSGRLDKLSKNELFETFKSKNIGYIIPTRDGELEFWAGLKNELKKLNIHVMVSAQDQVAKCLDKLAFSDFCKSSSMPAIPASLRIEDIAADKYVVKERFGAGSRNIGIKLSKEDALEKAKTLEFPIFQPYIEGSEFSFDAYIDAKGFTKGLILRKRDLVVNGESQITTGCNDIEIERALSDIISKFKFSGHIVGQVIIGVQKSINIIEINPRFGGASTLSINSGLDSFFWFLAESSGAGLEAYPFIKPEKPLKQIRYPQDMVIQA